MSSQTQTREPRRRFVGRKTNAEGVQTDALVPSSKRRTARVLNQIPEDILNNEELNEAIKLLPANYNFEIHKTVWNIKKANAKRVALQMPEGLLIYSLVITDILEQFCNVETIVMGDVTYGACCVDDFTARALECDFLVHYAHSCLVPITVTELKVLYIFVTIGIDETHLIRTLQRNFPNNHRIAMFGTIQFNPTIHSVKAKLLAKDPNETDEGSGNIYITAPQATPLSKGEVLGCTSARLNSEEIDAMVYLGDGRFHLESAMIHNPQIPAYRYDPYSRKFTREYYDFAELSAVRRDAIATAANSGKTVGIILGTLGRQGSTATVDNLRNRFITKGFSVVTILLSEIFPAKLAAFADIDLFVQVACPRLSIDWGYAFSKPLLTPYEAMVLLQEDEMFGEIYPMDYYATDGYGRGKIPRHEYLKQGKDGK